jgi:hypothetical protein
MRTPHSQYRAPRDPIGKAIALVFLAIWTLGAGGIAIAFLAGASAFSKFEGPGGSGPGALAAVPAFMAIVPIGFVVIGILMFIKVAATPTSSRTEVYRQVVQSEKPPEEPTSVVVHACPGCGSRKNVPGALVCAYCGGNLGTGVS